MSRGLTRRDLVLGRLFGARTEPELAGVGRGVALTEPTTPSPADTAPAPDESTPPWLINRPSPS